MCNEIIVLGRVEAEDFECGNRWGCISIANTDNEYAEIPEFGRVAFIQVAFADVEFPHVRHICFNDEHAHEILDFVTLHWDRFDTLLVQCDAGISRSSATAAAIAKLKFGDGSEFFELPFSPNQRVFQTLLEVSAGRGDYSED